jgi:integrase
LPIAHDPEALAAPLRVGLVEAYVLERTDPDGDALSPASATRHLAAIRWWHHRAGFSSPTDHPRIAEVVSGLRRLNGSGVRRVRPLFLEDIHAAVAALDDSPIGRRNRAILLLGWWGALRRSELVAINRDDLEEHPEGILVRLRRTKTDQTGFGRQVPLHYRDAEVCPVRALRAWLEVNPSEAVFVAVHRSGLVFPERRLGGGVVAATVKAAAMSIGIDQRTVSGHSLRAGFVSECDRRGIAGAAVRIVTGHASEAMLNVYQRPGNLFRDSAGALF